MTRTLVCSGLFLTLGLASAQPPASKDPQKKDPPSREAVLEVQLTPASPTGLDAALAQALKNHPDVRLADAKRQAAEAELAQAKLAVAQKVTAAYGKLQQARAKAAAAAAKASQINQLAQTGGATQAVVVEANATLAQAKADLAAAEAEFRAAVGTPPGTPVANFEVESGPIRVYEWQLNPLTVAFDVHAALPKPAAGSAADKLRRLVDKRVVLDVPRVPFDEAMRELMAKSGLNELTVRYPEWASAQALKNPPLVGPLRGEQTVDTWLQLILDDFNQSLVPGHVFPQHAELFAGGKNPFEAYVREYGLLITNKSLAPPSAVTLSDFAWQVRAGKAAEAAKPEPKK